MVELAVMVIMSNIDWASNATRLISAMHWSMHNIAQYLGGIGSNGMVDKAAFWTSISAIGTLFILGVAWWELQAMNNTTKAKFANDFAKDFFSPKTRTLIMLFNYDLLKFNKHKTGKNKKSNKEYPYFELVDRTVVKKTIKISDKDEKELKDVYSVFEIDDNLLGYFEDIGNFKKEKLLDKKMVYEMFDWYIGEIGGNEEIIAYINWQRDDGSDIYSGFERIYKELYPDRPKWDTYKELNDRGEAK